MNIATQPRREPIAAPIKLNVTRSQSTMNVNMSIADAASFGVKPGMYVELMPGPALDSGVTVRGVVRAANKKTKGYIKTRQLRTSNILQIAFAPYNFIGLWLTPPNKVSTNFTTVVTSEADGEFFFTIPRAMLTNVKKSRHMPPHVSSTKRKAAAKKATTTKPTVKTTPPPEKDANWYTGELSKAMRLINGAIKDGRLKVSIQSGGTLRGRLSVTTVTEL